ncbi:MAG TPA: carbohydrate-binding protein [Phycisphaerales bacterium]|nr:carbohydrate-binding protein [Phycisphaerales bacterium]
MKKSLGLLTLLFGLALHPAAVIGETQKERDARMAWWRDARFGMFIHWGLYAIPAGEWKGGTNHAEWIRHTAQIPLEEYDRFVHQFNPTRFDPDEWVRLAKYAGMKYIVITSKHHDGFCLWDSKQTDYDVMSTPYGQDILRKLTDACNRHGLRMCFYHSIMDWHHPDYLPRRPWEAASRPAQGADFSRYIAYMKRQLAELIQNYRPHVLWFDGEWESTWTHDMGADLYNYVRGLKPEIIINNRVDKGRQGMQGLTREGDYRGDFGTPEQEIPHQGLPGVDWESCMTMNDHWGWNKNDHNWKSGPDLIRKLIDIASKGGNFLLNVGPKPDGTFPQEAIERLKEIGDWMQINGQAIYGTSANPFKRLAWGRCTKKVRSSGATLYLHVFNWPADGKLLVPGLHNNVTRAYFLAGGHTVEASKVDDGWLLRVPRQPLDPVATVIVLEVTGELKIEDIPIRQQDDGSVVLPATQAEIHDTPGGQAPQVETKYGKPNIGYWLDARDWVSWAFRIDRPGTFELSAEMASQNPSRFELRIGSQVLTAEGPDTGGYDNFKTVSLGKLKIGAPGDVTLELRPVEGAWNPINVRSVILRPAK